MDPVGITKASTTKARKTNARTNARIRDSKVSLSVWRVVFAGVFVCFLDIIIGKSLI